MRLWGILKMNNMNKDLIKNEINIELHYNFVNNDAYAINFYTRNTCSLAQVEIISYLVKTLYSAEKFEILSLPAQDGSFKDLTVVRFLNNNAGVLALIAILVPILLYKSQLDANRTTSDLNILKIIEECRNLDIKDEQVSIKPMIFEENRNIFEREIRRFQFKNYIEEIPKEKEFLKTGLEGNIQLSQPFIDKQQQYGRGVAWKGVYYGDDIFDENEQLIIEDGENIFFYMQDDEYKNQILNQEISFTSGDNIRVIFDISRYYDYINNKFSKSRLYVKKVVSHNDNLVKHKKELELRREKKKLEEQHKNQTSLFDDSQK